MLEWHGRSEGTYYAGKTFLCLHDFVYGRAKFIPCGRIVLLHNTPFRAWDTKIGEYLYLLLG